MGSSKLIKISHVDMKEHTCRAKWPHFSSFMVVEGPINPQSSFEWLSATMDRRGHSERTRQASHVWISADRHGQKDTHTLKQWAPELCGFSSQLHWVIFSCSINYFFFVCLKERWKLHEQPVSLMKTILQFDWFHCLEKNKEQHILCIT